MAAKRKFKLVNFLEVLSLRSVSTGVIARKIKCAQSTALRYLRELKKAKQVIEQRISNTINLWKLTGKRILLIDVDSTIPNLALMKISAYHKVKGDNVALIKLNLKRREKVNLIEKPDKFFDQINFFTTFQVKLNQRNIITFNFMVCRNLHQRKIRDSAVN